MGYAEPMTNPATYIIEGSHVTAPQAHAALPHLPYDCIRKRLRRGVKTWAALGEPIMKHIQSARKDESRRRRRELEALARQHADQLIADKLRIWTDWRGPVDRSPLVSPL